MDEKTYILKNKNLFVLAEAAGGIYNSSQIKAVCDIVDEEFAFLKITEDLRLGFILPAEKVAHTQSILAKSGILLRHYQGDYPASPKSCLGELCPFCEQDALGDAIELQTFLSEKFKQNPQSLSLAINGCERACLGSATEDINLIGEKSGYKIYIGGKKSEIPSLAEFFVDSISKTSNHSVSVSLDSSRYSKQGLYILELYESMNEESQAILYGKARELIREQRLEEKSGNRDIQKAN